MSNLSGFELVSPWALHCRSPHAPPSPAPGKAVAAQECAFGWQEDTRASTDLPSDRSVPAPYHFTVTCRRFGVYILAPKQFLASKEQQGQNLHHWHLYRRGWDGSSRVGVSSLSSVCWFSLMPKATCSHAISFQLSHRQKFSPLLGGGHRTGRVSMRLGGAEATWGPGPGQPWLSRGFASTFMDVSVPTLPSLGPGWERFGARTGAAACGLAKGNNIFAPVISS